MASMIDVHGRMYELRFVSKILGKAGDKIGGALKVQPGEPHGLIAVDDGLSKQESGRLIASMTCEASAYEASRRYQLIPLVTNVD